MTAVEFLLGLAAAVGIGALVGLEREHRRDSTQVYAGVRTFPLISAAGFLAATIGEMTSNPWMLPTGLAVAGLAAVVFFYVRFRTGEVGFTTPMAIVVTFLAGALIGLGNIFEGIVVAVITTFLLLTKRRLHRIAEALDEAELMGTIQFVALAFVALPLAAAVQGEHLGGLVGPGQPIDPRWTLFVVVVASAIAFVSFLALRQWGARHGLTAAGALGGLVSSEAATASLAALAKRARGLDAAAGAAVLAAASTALVRNVVLAGVADPGLRLLPWLAGILLVPLVVVAGSAFVLARRTPATAGTDDAEGQGLDIKNPFAIKPALTFAAVFTAVNATAVLLQDVAGPAGVYATSLGAVVSSGAVIASVANLVFVGRISLEVGIITAGMAVVISLVTRLGILALMNRQLIGHTVVPLMAAALATGLGIVLVL